MSGGKRDTAGQLDPGFERFVTQSSERLLRTAFLLCGDGDEAEDLLQVALIRVGRRWESAGAAPDAYAYRVLVNLVHDKRRQKRRRVLETPLGDVGDLGPAVSDALGGVLDRSVLLHAARVLPQRQREVLVLRFFADLSVEQTAEAMGASTGTVKTHTSRALAALRDALTEQSTQATPGLGR